MGRQELMNQVAMAEGYLNGVEACLPHPPGSLGEIAHVGGNLLQGQRTGNDLIGRAEHFRGGDALALRYELGVSSSASVVDMRHDKPAGLVHRVG